MVQGPFFGFIYQPEFCWPFGSVLVIMLWQIKQYLINFLAGNLAKRGNFIWMGQEKITVLILSFGQMSMDLTSFPCLSWRLIKYLKRQNFALLNDINHQIRGIQFDIKMFFSCIDSPFVLSLPNSLRQLRQSSSLSAGTFLQTVAHNLSSPALTCPLFYVFPWITATYTARDHRHCKQAMHTFLTHFNSAKLLRPQSKILLIWL